MIVIEQLSNAQVRLSYDGVVIYDSTDERTTRHYTEVMPHTLDGPRKRGLELKELAESYY